MRCFYWAFTLFHKHSQMNWGEGMKTCYEDVIAVTHTWVSLEIKSLEETVVREAVSWHFPRNSPGERKPWVRNTKIWSGIGMLLHAWSLLRSLRGCRGPDCPLWTKKPLFFSQWKKLVEPTPFIIPLLERERSIKLFEPLFHYWQMAIREFYTWQPEGWWDTSGHFCTAVVLW